MFEAVSTDKSAKNAIKVRLFDGFMVNRISFAAQKLDKNREKLQDTINTVYLFLVQCA